MSGFRIGEFFDAARALLGNGNDESGSTLPTPSASNNPLASLMPTDDAWSTQMYAGLAREGVVNRPLTGNANPTGGAVFAVTSATVLQTQEQDATPKITYRFTPPSSHDPLEVRNTLLREQFGYTDEEIKALDTQPGSPGLRLFYDREHPERQLTREDVDRLVASDGTVAFAIPAAHVARLHEFISARVHRETDANLDKLINGTPTERVQAALNLEQTARINSPEGERGLSETRRLIAQPANANNAALRLALAQMSRDRAAAFIGPQNPEQQYAEARSLTQEAVSLTNGRDRTEAALVNRQAAQLYRSIGDEVQAQQRERIARFYEVDEKERSTYAVENMLIPRWKPDPNGNPMMRATTEAETEQRQAEMLESEMEEPKVDMTHDPNELERNEARAEKVGTRTVWRKSQGKVRQVTEVDYSNYPVNERGISNGEAVGGLPIIINEALEYVHIWRSAGDAARKLNERERLERNVTESTNYRVPPRPEDLPRLRADLERQLGASNNPQARQAITVVMRQTEEASHAYWGR